MKRSEPENVFVLWFTGLSGAGKSTLADMLYDFFSVNGCAVEKLDGDKVRSIFPSTGFTEEARKEHIHRIGFTASLLEKHGVSVIASFISPNARARHFARNLCNNFIEVYLSTSLAECERRDTKGLYAKARSGQIKNFTGIDAPYEAPSSPELVIDTEKQTADESFATIVEFLKDFL